MTARVELNAFYFQVEQNSITFNTWIFLTAVEEEVEYPSSTYRLLAMEVAAVAVQGVGVALHNNLAAVDPTDRTLVVEHPAQAEALLVVEELDRQS